LAIRLNLIELSFGSKVATYFYSNNKAGGKNVEEK
jgi:hypothetical protein